jgi:hypothetical protein
MVVLEDYVEAVVLPRRCFTLLQLGGVPALVKLLSSDDREVLRNACLALTCCAKHPEALPQMYSLKSMKLLIELLSNGNEDVQEQASYTIGYAVFGEDNMKDFRQAIQPSFSSVPSPQTPLQTSRRR